MLERPVPAPSAVRLRAFVDAVFDAYYDWHIQSGHMELSDQMEVLLGLQPDTLPRTFEGWLGRVHPDERAKGSREPEGGEEGGVYEGEYRMRRGDGTTSGPRPWCHP